MRTHLARRLALAALLAAAVTSAPPRALASLDEPAEDGLRRLHAYITCAAQVFWAHDPLSTASAFATCYSHYRRETV